MCTLALCSFCVVMFVSPRVERLSVHRDERRFVGTTEPSEKCSLLYGPSSQWRLATMSAQNHFEVGVIIAVRIWL